MPRRPGMERAVSDRSGIEWTDTTWNPVAGCTVLSPGCTNCYAMKDAHRMGGNPNPKTSGKYGGLTKVANGHLVWTGTVRMWEPHLEQPLHWRDRRRVFVNSMSDLFHDGLPNASIDRVFDVMERANWHTFQVLSKRSERMRDYLNARYADRLPPQHVWVGVSVEDSARTARVDHLRDARCAVRFLSVEPLLGPLGPLDLAGIHWVIVGGESGPRHRPMDPDWAREVRDRCVGAGVPFFFKQWGGRTPKSAGRLLDSREWSQFPTPPPRHRARLLPPRHRERPIPA